MKKGKDKQSELRLIAKLFMLNLSNLELIVSYTETGVEKRFVGTGNLDKHQTMQISELPASKLEEISFQIERKSKHSKDELTYFEATEGLPPVWSLIVGVSDDVFEEFQQIFLSKKIDRASLSFYPSNTHIYGYDYENIHFIAEVNRSISVERTALTFACK